VVGFQDSQGPGDGATADGPGTAPDPDAPVAPEANQSAKCNTDDECPADRAHCAASHYCLQCLSDAHCPNGRCQENLCVPLACAPKEAQCNGNTVLTCNGDGQTWNLYGCPEGTCKDGKCGGCTPGTAFCDGLEVLACSPDGSGFTHPETCASKCLGGACVTCYEGQKQCQGNFVETCNATGAWESTEDCNAKGMNCALGTCVSACFADLKSHSNAGCDYWAVDLDNLSEVAANLEHGIVVANLADKDTEVVVLAKDGAADPTQEIAKQTVPAGALAIFELPPRNMGGPGIFWRAYRVQSKAPIIAYQFNPLENKGTYSNDASLLIPATSYGLEYLVLGWPQQHQMFNPNTQMIQSFPEEPNRAAVAVMATQSATTVTVTPTCKTQAGGGLQNMQAGKKYQYVLEPFQILNIKSDQLDGDLSGTRITADKPIGVFTSSDCAFADIHCCCDHLEEQLAPINTWGTRYVGTKSWPRGVESDYWRVMAAEDGTKVTFDPAVVGPQTLQSGQVFELKTTQDFVVTGDKPIVLMQVLAGAWEIPGDPSWTCTTDPDCFDGYTCDWFFGQCNAPQCPFSGSCPKGHTCVPDSNFCEPIGDPLMIFAAPVEQFRSDYVFLTPNNYLEDYINVIALPGATVTLDDQPIAGGKFVAFGSQGYQVARLPVQDGVHKLHSESAGGSHRVRVRRRCLLRVHGRDEPERPVSGLPQTFPGTFFTGASS
jgi:hypothetical protein